VIQPRRYYIIMYCPRRNRPPVPLDRRLGGLQSRFGRRAEEKILPLTGLDLRTLGRPAHSQSLYWLNYLGFIYLLYASGILWERFRNLAHSSVSQSTFNTNFTNFLWHSETKDTPVCATDCFIIRRLEIWFWVRKQVILIEVFAVLYGLSRPILGYYHRLCFLTSTSFPVLPPFNSFSMLEEL
jgi:hypothetical protein